MTMGRWEAWGLFLPRLAAGLMLVGFHGWSKMNAAYGYFLRGESWRFIETVAQIGFPFPAFFALMSALAEFVGGLLMAVGLFTRWAAFFVSLNMAVAVYRHIERMDWGFEKAALYLLIALAALLQGPGPLSLDARIRKPRNAARG